jgi:hypothetical protein
MECAKRLLRECSTGDFTFDVARCSFIVDITMTEAVAAEREAAKGLVEALEWLKPYAEVQVRRHSDAEDTPYWKKLLAALATYRAKNRKG